MMTGLLWRLLLRRWCRQSWGRRWRLIDGIRSLCFEFRTELEASFCFVRRWTLTASVHSDGITDSGFQSAHMISSPSILYFRSIMNKSVTYGYSILSLVPTPDS